VNITSKQWFQIISGVVSGLITGAALLNPLFGETLALQIVAVLGIVNIVLNSIGTSLSGQGNLVKDVLAMPGVEKINIGPQANQTLAQIAIDPSIDRILAAALLASGGLTRWPYLFGPSSHWLFSAFGP
jgi:hypothetical protein